jgi:hypothetical protein
MRQWDDPGALVAATMEGIAAAMDAAQQVVERLSRSTGLINAPVMVVDDDAAPRCRRRAARQRLSGCGGLER